MKKQQILFPAVSVTAALLLTVGVMSVFSACGPRDDGNWMRCHAAQSAVGCCGSGLAVLLMLAALIKKRTVRVILYSAALAGSVSTFLLPGLLMPMCMMRSMRCYTLFQPFVRIMTALIFCLCVIGILRTVRDRTR